jgi:hypothetical protein
LFLLKKNLNRVDRSAEHFGQNFFACVIPSQRSDTPPPEKGPPSLDLFIAKRQQGVFDSRALLVGDGKIGRNHASLGVDALDFAKKNKSAGARLFRLAARQARRISLNR